MLQGFGGDSGGLNLREMLLGDPCRLRYVVRFSTCHRVHDESVAEHSFYTALYGTLLARAVNRSPAMVTKIDVGLVAVKALIHDVDECLSGDFPRPFKYSSPQLAEALHEGASGAFRECFRKILDDAARFSLQALWENSKDRSTYEGRIVEFADYLSVLSYIWSEVNGSNITMKQHLIEMEKYHSIFLGSQFDFLSPWVDEAGKILKEVLQ